MGLRCSSESEWKVSAGSTSQQGPGNVRTNHRPMASTRDTLLLSDGWAAYRNLHNLNGGVYLHDVVIHDQHFVDPIYPEISDKYISGRYFAELNLFQLEKIKFQLISYNVYKVSGMVDDGNCGRFVESRRT